jgi:uncharacterized protein YidB (DUF937 family)
MDRHRPQQADLDEPAAPALGPETVDGLSRETGLPRDDLLAQLSRLLPEVIDKLTPNGKLPREEDLLPGPNDSGHRREGRSA